MDFDAIIGQALQRLKPNTTFRLANEARPNSDYLFNSYLPERTDYSYTVSSAQIIVRSQMAGLSAMDSPYNRVGTMSMSDFMESIAKITSQVDFTEAQQRKMQEIAVHLGMSGNAPMVVAQNLLNWYNKLVIQPHLDTAEWLRGQALVNGLINWEFNGQKLAVDYGYVTAQKASYSGNDAFGGTTSKFWVSHKAALKYLKYNVSEIVMHPETLDVIISNPNNNLEIVSQSGQTFEVVKIVGSLEKRSTDFRERVTLKAYGLETEVMDPNNPGDSIIMPFIEPGKVMYVGKNVSNSFVLTKSVGEGSTPNSLINEGVNLGYTHLGPTIEGGGQPGRWGRVYQPQDRPFHVAGQAVTNLLPVIERPELIYVASTEMPA